MEGVLSSSDGKRLCWVWCVYKEEVGREECVDVVGCARCVYVDCVCRDGFGSGYLNCHWCRWRVG